MSPIIQFFIIFISSLIISPLILRGVSFLLKKYNLLDRPHLYKSEKWRSPAPYGAGISLIVMLLIMSPLLFLFADFTLLLEKRLIIYRWYGYYRKESNQSSANSKTIDANRCGCNHRSYEHQDLLYESCSWWYYSARFFFFYFWYSWFSAHCILDSYFCNDPLVRCSIQCGELLWLSSRSDMRIFSY